MKSNRDRASDSEADPEAPEVTSEDWARRLQRGNPEAVRVVRERVGKILAFKGLGAGHREREDLQQEVMTELWQAVNRSSFDFTAGFWGFVEVVTARRCIDWLRTKREIEPLDETFRDSSQSPLGTTLERERSEVVHEVLDELGASCRKLILLRLRDDLSYEEISEVTGKSKGALRVQMYRCVRKAKERLEEVAAEEDL